jgi:hypothetical protein
MISSLIQGLYGNDKQVFRNGKLILLGPKKIVTILGALGETLHIPKNICTGIARYFIEKNLYRSPEDLITAIQFIIEICGITNEQTFFKSNNPQSAFSQGSENAQFMISLMGMDFFLPSSQDPLVRKNLMLAELPGTDLYLSCKGGSGAGTFSLDFAIGVLKDNKTKVGGELWRTGIDTEKTLDGRNVRIIRTGGLKILINR